MTDLTWGDGIVSTDLYSGQFTIKYTTSTEAGAWKVYFQSYKGAKVTYELYDGDMDAAADKGMALFNGVEAGTTILKDTEGNIVI